MSIEAFLAAATPLTECMMDLALDDSQQAMTTLNERASLQSELVETLRRVTMQGMEEGWLLTKEVGGIRFGRAAKDLNGFSVDAVLMDCPGPPHRHPKGEIDLCFALNDGAKFDGNEEGWVLYPPDSTHTPTVTDGKMLILYFLPGGAFEMLK